MWQMLSRLLCVFMAVRAEKLIDETLPKTFLSLELMRDRNTPVGKRKLQNGGQNNSSSEILPLFQGMGTHYSYIYVGTPPQKVTVIIDTGSHHTAFPCVGCNCGKHMNPLFDPSKSNSSKVLKCSGRRCFFQQSYSEGSSWHAFKVSDRLWMGGESTNMIASAVDFSVNFQFGCQDSETGLFRTQHVDGIMGMSAADDTIPHQLFTQKITGSRIFAMCFSVGGGILTLGGVDQSIHNHGEVIKYAKLQKPKGWFTVKLLDITMRPTVTSSLQTMGQTTDAALDRVATHSISADSIALNGRKGVIIDSGTTDTYLPSSVKTLFEELFKKVTDGIVYTNGNIILSAAQVNKLPTIIYTLEGPDGEPPVEVDNEPSSYVENLGDGVYAFRIYLTEASGAILGANLMNDHNVIFDIDSRRVGFVRSSCQYDAGAMSKTSQLHVSHEHYEGSGSTIGRIQKSLSALASGLLGF